MRARGRVLRAAVLGALVWTGGGSPLAQAARPQGVVLEASRLKLDGKPVGAGTPIARGQHLALPPDGAATIAFPDAAIRLSEGAQAQILEIGPKIKIGLTTGSLLAVAGTAAEVQAHTLHAAAACRGGAVFVSQGPGTPTYVCACGGHVTVAETGGPPTHIPAPHHKALLVDGFAFKPAASDRHGGQEIWSLIMDLGPAAGEPLRGVLWNAIVRAPGSRRAAAPIAVPEWPDLPRPANAAAPPRPVAGSPGGASGRPGPGPAGASGGAGPGAATTATAASPGGATSVPRPAPGAPVPAIAPPSAVAPPPAVAPAPAGAPGGTAVAAPVR
ncbi:MAG: hypothetical protein FJZ01_27115, partial [Candidatus Sericytochromatia bacterium]|nr:hypothetical protein [Candidatus Tanganyikabacteria bacterium]